MAAENPQYCKLLGGLDNIPKHVSRVPHSESWGAKHISPGTRTAMSILLINLKVST